jgi:hypothetical protein
MRLLLVVDKEIKVFVRVLGTLISLLILFKISSIDKCVMFLIFHIISPITTAADGNR